MCWENPEDPFVKNQGLSLFPQKGSATRQVHKDDADESEALEMVTMFSWKES